MYSAKVYKGFSVEGIIAKVKKEGFEPVAITNASRFVYHGHKHPETKVTRFSQRHPFLHIPLVGECVITRYIIY